MENTGDPYSSPDAHDEMLKRLIKMAWDRYEPETKDFFVQLSNKDPDIKEQLDKLDTSPETSKADRLGNSERKGGGGEVIVPSVADTSSDGEE
jgi:hypothetical protein